MGWECKSTVISTGCLGSRLMYLVSAFGTDSAARSAASCRERRQAATSCFASRAAAREARRDERLRSWLTAGSITVTSSAEVDMAGGAMRMASERSAMVPTTSSCPSQRSYV